MSIYPAYKGLITIASGSNDAIAWVEDDGTPHPAATTVAAGSYYPAALVDAIVGAMTTESGLSALGLIFTGAIDDDTGIVTITCSSETWYPKLTAIETNKILTGGDQAAGSRGDNHVGWNADGSYAALAVSHSSDVAHCNAWYPTQGKLSDDQGNRQNVTIESTSIGGTTTTYSFGPATRGSDLTRLRKQAFEELTDADRTQYEDEFWHPFAKQGGVFRYFNDRTDTATYALYRLTGESLKTPGWSRSRPTVGRWALGFEMRRSS